MWQQLFQQQCPGVVLRNYGTSESVRSELSALRTAGELAEYTDDELLFRDMWALWRKS